MSEGVGEGGREGWKEWRVYMLLLRVKETQFVSGCVGE